MMSGLFVISGRCWLEIVAMQDMVVRSWSGRQTNTMATEQRIFTIKRVSAELGSDWNAVPMVVSAERNHDCGEHVQVNLQR